MVQSTSAAIVNLALLHVAQRAQHEFAHRFVAGLRPANQGEIDRFRMGELVFAAPATVNRIGGF